MRTKAVCVVCGKQFVHYHSHPQECCSKACRIKHGYKSKSKVIIAICEVCGREFEYYGTPRRFCSRKCRLEAGWVISDPAKRSIFTCEWCGDEFEEWTYRQSRFCSSQCRSEYGARRPRPTQRKPERLVTRKCGFCEKEYTTTKTQIEHGSRFCSNECKYAAMSLEKRGENNPLWNGGMLDPDAYGANWGRQKRRVKKRDRHTCQVCGYRAGGNLPLDIHHIRKIREFNGDWEFANDLSNLVCLCRPCHRKVEFGDIECPTPATVDAATVPV